MIELADEIERVMAAAELFDRTPSEAWASRFLRLENHHLLIASVGGVSVGFVTGMELTHPDKGTEMLLYELGVAENHRQRGIGRALVEALADLARHRECRGMWVPIDAGDAPAEKTYRSAGAQESESALILSWDFRSG